MTARPFEREGNESAADTRQALLDAASGLFANKGFKATSISDIAAASGVNRALISYHFGGKAGLYEELLNSAIDDAAETLTRLEFDADAPDPERRLIHAFAQVYTAHPYLAPMLLREHLDPEAFRTVSAADKLRGFGKLTNQMLDAIELRPEARKYDRQIVHLICVGALIYFLVTDSYRAWAQDALDPPPTRPPLDAFVSTLADFLSRALRD